MASTNAAGPTSVDARAADVQERVHLAPVDAELAARPPTLEALEEGIKHARANQSQHGPSGLYDRKMTVRGDAAEAANGPNVRVMQFNTLAEGLCAGVNGPLWEEVDAGDRKVPSWGGFTEVPLPESSLAWEWRKWRLLEVIREHAADIVALQECDHFPDHFKPWMSAMGYDGVFSPKPDSTCISFGYYSDGCALFFRADAFEQLSFETSRCLLISRLRHRATGDVFLVATTHLKAKTGQPNEDRRAKQVQSLLGNISDMRRQTSIDHVLVVGDFNTDPFDVSQHHSQQGHKARAVPTMREHNDPVLLSAYPLPESEDEAAHGGHSTVTTWKRRGEDETRHQIDYIWHSASLRCVSTLDPPLSTDVVDSRLPGFNYPSDHFAIVANFALPAPAEA